MFACRQIFLICLTLACATSFPATAIDAEKEEAWVAKRRTYWAFRNPVRPEVPVDSDAWIQNPVDAFILERLRAKGLTPSAALGRRQLLRRVTLDLTGLPPTPREIDAFLADRRQTHMRSWWTV